MKKPTHGAERLHALVVARWRELRGLGPVPAGPAVVIEPAFGMPYAHPRDALGRNWDIAQVSGAGPVWAVRVVIDQLRESYDLSADETAGACAGPGR